MKDLTPPAAPAVRSSPLVDALFARHGFARVGAPALDAFAAGEGHAVVAFLEDPARVRETQDLAVILPELARAFPARFRVGVLLPEDARAVAPRYGLRRWPALVVLKEGRYVGAVEGLRGWDEYVAELARLLEAAPTRPPVVGIAVRAEGAGG